MRCYFKRKRERGERQTVREQERERKRQREKRRIFVQIHNPTQGSFVVLGEKKTRCLWLTDLKKREGEEGRVV